MNIRNLNDNIPVCTVKTVYIASNPEVPALAPGTVITPTLNCYDPDGGIVTYQLSTGAKVL